VAYEEADPQVRKAGKEHELIAVPMSKEGGRELLGSVKADNLSSNQA
jgi:hypothetical protein